MFIALKVIVTVRSISSSCILCTLECCPGYNLSKKHKHTANAQNCYWVQWQNETKRHSRKLQS